MIKHFRELTSEDLYMVGGKGINLGLMLQAGIPVPDGFCILTPAFNAHLDATGLEVELGVLNQLQVDDLTGIEAAGKMLREQIRTASVSSELKNAVREALEGFEPDTSFAVRSSATAEDLPDASFAGQQDSYLFVKGEEAVLQAVRDCWASLFNDRAISYRLKNAIPNKGLSISVVVQRMIDPIFSGVLFTADPVSENRDWMTVEYVAGVGEDLVAGKKEPHMVAYDKEKGEILSDQQVPGNPDKLQELTMFKLFRLGTEIEEFYGRPMDIEWAQDGAGRIWILQARAITTLLPLINPQREGSAVYLSFHHVQNMMQPFRPLGASCLQLVLPFDRDETGKTRIFQYANGFLFADMTDYLAVSFLRRTVGSRFDGIDAVMAGSLRRLWKDKDFVRNLKPIHPKGREVWAAVQFLIRGIWRAGKPNESNIERCNVFIDEYVGSLKKQLESANTDSDRLEICISGLQGYLKEAFTRFVPLIGPGLGAYRLLVNKTEKKLGSDELAQTLVKGLKGNATTEMGLVIGDLAERIREEKVWRTRLDQWDARVFVTELMKAETPAGDQMRLVMDRYGSRGIGEIDLTSIRWFEDPSAIVLSIKNHLRNYRPNQHRVEYDAMTSASLAAAEEIVIRLGGRNPIRVRFYQAMVNRVLYMMPAREHPKYGMVQVFGQVKKQLLRLGENAVDKDLLQSTEDMYFLEFDEIRQMIKEEMSMKAQVVNRRQAFQRASTHRIPRVVTNRGWIVPPESDGRTAGENELLGFGVSSGIVEGFARVVRSPLEARMQPGEILIAPFTDPGWTPLFIHAKGLVLEVGGMLTHGAIVAREYGIPAVVGVNEAMERINTGDLLRVDGDKGLVTVLKRKADMGNED